MRSSSRAHKPVLSGGPGGRPDRTGPPLAFMPEFAIVSTLALIAAPVVLVTATAWMALKKRRKDQAADASDSVRVALESRVTPLTEK